MMDGALFMIDDAAGPASYILGSALAAFLLGDEASFISGTNVKADGLWALSGGGM